MRCMIRKSEKTYSVRIECLYRDNDLVFFLNIMAIMLSISIGFFLLSVIVVLFRSWLYY